MRPYVWPEQHRLAVEDPDKIGIESPEVDTIISEAGRMIPHFNNTRIIRAFSGVRPLLKSKKMDSHEISRGFQIIDHENGMYSIVGGKLYDFPADGGKDGRCHNGFF